MTGPLRGSAWAPGTLVRRAVGLLPRGLYGAVQQGMPPALRSVLPFNPNWRIGMASGPLVADARADRVDERPALTWRDVRDVRAAFVADPFAVATDAGWHLFFEVLNRDVRRGQIGLATSPDGRAWTYQRIVLAEPFHLSYPHVFEHDGQHFLVPESEEVGAVRLYRATDFPWSWRLECELLRGRPFRDATVFRHDGRWWMLAETSSSARFDTLRLYASDELTGPWREHPSSPVVTGDVTSARPAGPVLAHDGLLLRFAQDCRKVYGHSVRAFQITELTPTAYRERALAGAPSIGAGRARWGRRGMHHLDVHPLPDGGWRGFVDGR